MFTSKCLKESLELSSRTKTLIRWFRISTWKIFVEASISDKMTKSHLRRFCEHIFFGENVDDRAWLLVDSSARHKDSETTKLALPSKYVNVLLISERTAKHFQPLDVFYFRHYKIYVRRTEDHARVCLHDSGIKLHDHSFTMKIHSVVYDQLGAPAYTNMLHYAWKKLGYAIHRSYDALINTIAVSFNFGMETCLIHECTTFVFIRCSCCTRFYCF
jgi:hypothetical protein